MAEGNILVIAEARDGKLLPISDELVGCARKLAGDTGSELTAALVGSGITPLAAGLIARGATRVFVTDEPIFKDYDTGAFTNLLEKLAR